MQTRACAFLPEIIKIEVVTKDVSVEEIVEKYEIKYT